MLFTRRSIAGRKCARSSAVGMLILLASCGFQPIHNEKSVASMSALANFDVALISDRKGQMLRNELLKELQPQGAILNPRFSLRVTLTETLSNLAIRKDDAATRANLNLSAAFSVTLRADEDTLFYGTVNSVNSFNILTSDYATLSARADARRRAVKQLALQLKERLSIWLIQTGGRKVTK